MKMEGQEQTQANDINDCCSLGPQLLSALNKCFFSYDKRQKDCPRPPCWLGWLVNNFPNVAQCADVTFLFGTFCI